MTGYVNATNSLVGSRTGTFQGATVTELTNGNIVIAQPNWTDDQGVRIGAATLIDMTNSSSLTGVFDASNSLVGSSQDDFEDVVVMPLTNGNYVVGTRYWDGEGVQNAAAVTWRSGTTAVGAVISSSNSLIHALVGTALDNGNVVLTRSGYAGVFDGATGFSGTLSNANSLFYQNADILTSVLQLPNGKIALAFAHSNGDFSYDDGALWIGEPVVGIHGELTPDNSLTGIPVNLGRPNIILPNSNIVVDVYGVPPSIYFANGSEPRTGTFSPGDAFDSVSFFMYELANGNVVTEGVTPDGLRGSLLVEMNDAPSGAFPLQNVIPGKSGIALGNGNYAVPDGLDTHVGDGLTPGVYATAPGPGPAWGPVAVSDNGNFIRVGPVFELGNVGAILFVNGSPDFQTDTVTSNVFLGTRSGFHSTSTGYSVVTDDVNQHFYVTFTADGVSRVVAGSTIDGFANNGTGPAVSLSVSSSVGAEANQTQITVTATADAPVTGDQVVVVATSGTGITETDFSLSSRTIIIPDGQTSGTVTLNIASDSEIEGTETLVLTLASPSTGIRLGDTIQHNISIADNIARVTLETMPRFPDSSTPTFTWNDLGADRYEVWLGQTTPVASRVHTGDRFVTTNSYTPTSNLTAGTYRVWVRVSESSGALGPWSVPVTIDIRPTLLAPQSEVSTARPTFTWEAVPGAAAYQIWINTSSGRIIENDIVGTSWNPAADLPAGTIRWWIRATAPAATSWSAPGTAVITGSDRSSVLTPMGSLTDTTPTFSWSSVSGSTRYILHVQNLTTGSVVIREDNLTDTSYTPTTALTSGSYRVWVKAIGPSGNFTDGFWSAPVDFSIAAVTQDALDVLLPPLLTGLPVALQTRDKAQHGRFAVTAEASIQNIAIDVEETNGKNGQQRTDETSSSAAAAAQDSPELLLSLLWQQPQLQEWLLLEDQSVKHPSRQAADRHIRPRLRLTADTA
ncbi:MAG: hypothetical protein R3C49_12255 [Planctomycetaceae bacterium]